MENFLSCYFLFRVASRMFKLEVKLCILCSRETEALKHLSPSTPQLRRDVNRLLSPPAKWKIFPHLTDSGFSVISGYQHNCHCG